MVQYRSVTCTSGTPCAVLLRYLTKDAAETEGNTDLNDMNHLWKYDPNLNKKVPTDFVSNLGSRYN